MLATTLVTLTSLCSAYRPVQHCKPLGDNGHYSACTSITQYFNQTTGESDLYLRYHWHKYKDSANGWHAIALGQQMAGAFMLTMYGNPLAVPPDMTTSVRSAEGHHAPLLIKDLAPFQRPEAKGRIPDVDIITSRFEPYTGAFTHPKLGLKPSHVGIVEVIVRGFTKWVGCKVTNTSTSEALIWSSRYDQDFGGDFSIDRSLDMHAFGLGFGNIFMDMRNAETPIPMFAPIHEYEGSYGLLELGTAQAPSAEEVVKGEEYVADALDDPVNVRLQSQVAGVGARPVNTDNNGNKIPEHNPFDEHNTAPSTSTAPSATAPAAEAITTTAPVASPPVPTRPAYTIKGKSLRDWMWHLHGLLLSAAFFVLYPLGIYFLRQPKAISNGDAFNYHWTIQALATVTFSLGTFIGWFQSRTISVTHQYIGITIALLISTQMLLGWRHHLSFLVHKRSTLLSKIHITLGRIILPFALVNILTGLFLRGYGWFTILLAAAASLALLIIGAIYLRTAAVRRAKLGPAADTEAMKTAGPGAHDDAEEYFQLASAEDEWSDDNEEQDENKLATAAAAKHKLEQREEKQRKLARLDRV